MKITYDKIANAVYIYLTNNKVEKTVKINDNFLLDVDKDGKVIGIEVLSASSEIDLKGLQKNSREGVFVDITKGAFAA